MIYLIWGPPGAGKTYFATKIAFEQYSKGRSVYSNYPIIERASSGISLPSLRSVVGRRRSPGLFSSYVWRPEYVYESIVDAVIIIDEAYRDYNSRQYRNFTVDMHTFFATQRHNNLDVYLIAQNPARVDVIIREIVNVFYYVRPWLSVPFLRRPLGFSVTGYLTEADMLSRSSDSVYSRERFLFSWRIANSYDTRYYRSDAQTVVPVRWDSLSETKSEDI